MQETTYSYDNWKTSYFLNYQEKFEKSLHLLSQNTKVIEQFMADLIINQQKVCSIASERKISSIIQQQLQYETIQRFLVWTVHPDYQKSFQNYYQLQNQAHKNFHKMDNRRINIIYKSFDFLFQMTKKKYLQKKIVKKDEKDLLAKLESIEHQKQHSTKITSHHKTMKQQKPQNIESKVQKQQNKLSEETAFDMSCQWIRQIFGQNHPEPSHASFQRGSRDVVDTTVHNLNQSAGALKNSMKNRDMMAASYQIKNSRQTITYLEKLIANAITNLQDQKKVNDNKSYLTTEQRIKTRELIKNENVGEYPIMKWTDEGSSGGSLEIMQDYLLKKHKNLEREEFVVDYQIKEKIFSCRRQLLKKVIQQINKIRTKYRFIGDNLEQFLQYGLQTFISPQNLGEIDEYSQSLKEVQLLTIQQQTVPLEIQPDYSQVFTSIKCILKGRQDQMKCLQNLWNHTQITHMRQGNQSWRHKQKLSLKIKQKKFKKELQ